MNFFTLNDLNTFEITFQFYKIFITHVYTVYIFNATRIQHAHHDECFVSYCALEEKPAANQKN